MNFNNLKKERKINESLSLFKKKLSGNNWKKYLINFFIAILFTGCTGIQRGCSSWWATNAGADWIIVQYAANGDPINCWKLNNTSVTNEGNSDGIYWEETNSGHLVHISGWYNRVQVKNGEFEEAAKLLGIDVHLIKNGKYKQ